jgi:hypothetical protein
MMYDRLILQRFGACMLLGAALLTVAAQPAGAQIFKLPQPDTTMGNFFGVAVSIDGDRALIGATGEDVCGENSGAAYIYERDPGTDEWHQVTRLQPRDCTPGYFFGRTLALSGDRAVVAAFRPFFSTAQSNAAYVFERDPASGTWKQTARLTAASGFEEGAFAASVSLDGGRALITTSGDRSEGRYGGAAYIFEHDPGTGRWKQAARLTGSGRVHHGIFGTSGDLDGDRAVVSASTYFAEQPGSVYVFEREGGTWKEKAHIRGVDDFFISVALDGDRVLVGESKGGRNASGLATLYERDADGRWAEAAALYPRVPYKLGAFGSAVALQGDRALVVGYDEQLSLEFNIDRVVYLFVRDPELGAWKQRRVFDIGEVSFGSAIDLDEHFALIGQSSEQHPGLAYVVRIP